jgi:hypothetical protein
MIEIPQNIYNAKQKGLIRPDYALYPNGNTSAPFREITPSLQTVTTRYGTERLFALTQRKLGTVLIHSQQTTWRLV